jgi:c-di-GMP-binding flagellar brake protein YcgR
MYSARLENISLAGALVSLQEGDCPPMSRGERCSLALYRSGSSGTLQFTTKVVHFGYDMASVRFVNLDQNTRLMLRSIIAHQMPERRPAAPRISNCRV